MPNWTSNTLCVEGNDLDVKTFITKVTADKYNTQEYAILATLIPVPEGQEWYEWNIANWGTKWEDNGTTLTITDKGFAMFRFDTAWSPPVEGITTISTMFPSLTFVLSYSEMGMGFVGSAGFLDGLVHHASSENIQMEGSEENDDLDMDALYEAYDLALDICEVEARQVLSELSNPSPLQTTTKG